MYHPPRVRMCESCDHFNSLVPLCRLCVTVPNWWRTGPIRTNLRPSHFHACLIRFVDSPLIFSSNHQPAQCTPLPLTFPSSQPHSRSPPLSPFLALAMKIKRHKRIRKILQFYHLSYHITAPYRVVLDPHFIQAAHDGKVMIRDQLPTLFHQPTTPYITPCILAWMEAAGRGWEASVFIGRQLGFLSCRHKKKGKIHPEACIKALLTPQRHLMEGGGEAGQKEEERKEGKEEEKAEDEMGDGNAAARTATATAAAAASTSSLSSTSTSVSSATRLPASIPTSLSHLPLNPDKLIVAAQSSTLRDWVRATPGIPLLFLHGSVPVMEAPSGVERFDRKQKAVEDSGRLTEVEEKALTRVRDKAVGGGRTGWQGDRSGKGGPPRKKKAKGPNPLSVKKKKKKAPQPTGGAAGAKRKQAEVSSDENSSNGAASGGIKRRKTGAESGAGGASTGVDE